MLPKRIFSKELIVVLIFLDKAVNNRIPGRKRPAIKTSSNMFQHSIEEEVL
jgi:hypothetical protein